MRHSRKTTYAFIVAAALLGVAAAAEAQQFAYFYATSNGAYVPRKIDLTNGAITTCALGTGDFGAFSAVGLAVNKTGNRVYAAIDRIDLTIPAIESRIREYDQNCNILRDLVLSQGSLLGISDIKLSNDDTRAYVVDSSGNDFYVVSLSGAQMQVVSSVEVNQAGEPACGLFGLAVNPANGNQAWVTSDNCDVARINMTAAGVAGAPQFVPVDPIHQGTKQGRGIAVHPSGGRVYVIRQRDNDTDFVKTINTATMSVVAEGVMLWKMYGLAVDNAGRLFAEGVAADNKAFLCRSNLTSAGDIMGFTESDPITGFNDPDIKGPRGVALNSAGNTVYAVFGNEVSRIATCSAATLTCSVNGSGLGANPVSVSMSVKPPCLGGCCF